MKQTVGVAELRQNLSRYLAHGVDLAADAPPDVTPIVDNRF